eukprot:CAMPEP_0206266474 /NCGR_PEP_ID=MMETSP0047_2-20121206/30593_1 /ASSEMBLY_ACC=CAM_ASM_000192 /TAXON_ID=195065 /ORGANISM="Chroomonas mesostigmatica_cf, Strain CCMP1168" /LENGTH=421 /DNA_ID=CAMNT_0053694529 /DNA_START=15 /DNA_END=1280 /DNA_ORIENTATION=-
MSELGCTLSDEQLAKPNPEHITRVMEQLLDLFMGFSAEENAQIKFSGMDAFDFPELHEYSIGQLAFNRSIMRLMHASGVHDFSLKDIQKPEYKRLLKLFSAVINFAKFREEKVGAYEEYVERTESLVQEKEVVDNKFEALTEQLHYLRAQRKQELPLITELEEDNQRMEDQIKALNVEQGAIKAKIHEIKQLRQATSDKRDHDQFTLLNVKAEVSKLQGLVVRSPEKAKKDIKDMGSQLEGDKELLIEMDTKLQSLRRKIDGLLKTEKDMGKLTKHLREAEECLGRLKAANKETKRLQGVMAEMKGQIEELDVQEHSLKRQANTTASRSAELESKQRLKREAAEREMERWKQMQQAADKENSHIQIQVDKMEDEARMLEKKMVELASQDQQDMDRLHAEHAKVEQELNSYNQRILAAISVE